MVFVFQNVPVNDSEYCKSVVFENNKSPEMFALYYSWAGT